MLWNKASPEWRKVLSGVWKLSAKEQRDMSLSVGGVRKKFGHNKSSGREFAVCQRRTILSEASRKHKTEGRKLVARLSKRNMGSWRRKKEQVARVCLLLQPPLVARPKKTKRKRSSDIGSRGKSFADWVLGWLVRSGIEPHPGPS